MAFYILQVLIIESLVVSISFHASETKGVQIPDEQKQPEAIR